MISKALGKDAKHKLLLIILLGIVALMVLNPRLPQKSTKKIHKPVATNDIFGGTYKPINLDDLFGKTQDPTELKAKLDKLFKEHPERFYSVPPASWPKTLIPLFDGLAVDPETGEVYILLPSLTGK